MMSSLDQAVDVFKHTDSDSAIQICDLQCYFRFAEGGILDAVGLNWAFLPINGMRLINQRFSFNRTNDTAFDS